MKICHIFIYRYIVFTLLGTNPYPLPRHFWVDDVPFPQMGYVSSFRDMLVPWRVYYILYIYTFISALQWVFVHSSLELRQVILTLQVKCRNELLGSDVAWMNLIATPQKNEDPIGCFKLGKRNQATKWHVFFGLVNFISWGRSNSWALNVDGINGYQQPFHSRLVVEENLHSGLV